MRLNEFEAVSSKYKGFKEKAAEAETETKVEKSTRPFFLFRFEAISRNFGK